MARAAARRMPRKPGMTGSEGERKTMWSTKAAGGRAALKATVAAALVSAATAGPAWAQGADALRRVGENGAPAAAANAAPRTPVRSETTPYDNWTLTCQEALPAAGAKAGRKTCWASMRVSDAKSQQVVLVWLIGKDAKDEPTVSIQTPTGVLVRDGVDVALGRNVRKLAYQWCDQTGCEASGPFDPVFARDLGGAREATISFKARDGRQVSVKVPVAGADKVVAALPK